jgi:hypothetical protein
MYFMLASIVCSICLASLCTKTPACLAIHTDKVQHMQDYSVADAQLFRVLGRPRPDDDARRLLAQNGIAIAV